MANRHTLALTSLDDFKTFLLSRGFTINAPKGDYEVLRASKEGRKHPVILYRRLTNRNGSELVHLTVMDRDSYVVRDYIRNKANKEKVENGKHQN